MSFIITLLKGLLSKALSPILTISLGIVTLLIFLLSKALSEIELIITSLIIEGIVTSLPQFSS